MLRPEPTAERQATLTLVEYWFLILELIMRFSTYTLLTLLGLLLFDQSTSAQQVDLYQLALHPAAEPVPALRYRLLPPVIDRTAGNAVVYYGKVPAEQTAFFSSREIWDEIHKAAQMSLKEVAGNEILRKATRDSSPISFMRLGARCQHADWQIPLREQPYFLILLPDVQQMRNYARLLAVRARIQIADGQINEAVETLQIGFAMAEHLCQAPVVVSGLVGAAIANMMLDVVEEMIEQPDSPNLYWALTSLPDPLVNLRPGFEVEQFSLYFTEPKWRDIESLEGDQAFWTKELQRLWTTLSEIAELESSQTMPQLTYVVMRSYPVAKQRLVDSGLTPQTIDTMPVAQVMMIDALRQFQILRDQMAKWSYVPFHQSRTQLRDAIQVVTQAFDSGHEPLPLSGHIILSLEPVMSSAVRVSRRVAALRIAEALRMHAANQGGQLPMTLNQVQLVPIPNDPSTGQQFIYKVESDTAELSSPELNFVNATWQFKLAN